MAIPEELLDNVSLPEYMSQSLNMDSKQTPSTSLAEHESITTAVVTAVTHAIGSKPATPLYHAIDPDGLEDLYQHSSPRVCFEYVGYQVTIHTDRTVTISDLDA